MPPAPLVGPPLVQARIDPSPAVIAVPATATGTGVTQPKK